jgi:DNA-binding SARP family transcriptional activator
MVRVALIGPPRIEGADGEVRPVRGHKPWVVLARVLLAGGPVSRRTLAQELFPDADDPLGSLRWCLAGLRRALDDPDCLTGDPLRADLAPAVAVDVLELGRDAVVPAADGELLEGIDPRCGPELATWLLVARRQVASRVDARLRDATVAALSGREAERALVLAGRLARRAPFDEGAHVLLVRALVAAGDAVGAARHVEEVTATFVEELGVEPSGALAGAARAAPAAPPGVAPAAVAAASRDAARAALAAGALDAGIEGLRRAVAQAEVVGDRALLASCRCELGTALVHSVRGADDEGMVLLEEAADLAVGCGDAATFVAARRERGYADTLAGRRIEADRHLRAASDALDGADDPLAAGVAAVGGLNLADWGRTDEAIDRFEEAIDGARRSGDRRREAWALGLGSWARVQGGDVGADAAAWADASVDLVRDLRWAAFEPWPLTVRAEIRLGEGAGPDDLERWFAMSCQLEDPCWEGGSGRVLALDHAARGRHDEALRWIVEARDRCGRWANTWTGLLGEICLTEADLRAEAGDGAGAVDAARRAVEVAARAQLDGVLRRALAHLGTSPSERPRTPGPTGGA